MRLGWLLVASLAIACDDPPEARPCGSLPDPSACPATRGGTCEDRSCSALYSCKAGTWVFVETCPQNTGGQGGSAGAPGTAGNAGAAGTGSCNTPSNPSGTCTALQPPDCDAALLDACPQDACALGCEGFLRCENQDWSAAYVAYCDEDGTLIKP